MKCDVTESPSAESADWQKAGRLMTEHQRFPQRACREGRVLFSSPQMRPRAGGIMVVKSPSMQGGQVFFGEDPLITSGVAAYRCSKLKAHQYQLFLEGWFAQ